MSELQALLSGWISNLTTVLPVGFAFGAGMVSAVNPCGFAMLPAYLSLYLGAEEDDFRKRSPVRRALRHARRSRRLRWQGHAPRRLERRSGESGKGDNATSTRLTLAAS